MNIRIELGRWRIVINVVAAVIFVFAVITLGAIHQSELERNAQDERFARNVRKYECARIAYQSDTWIYKCANGLFTRLELRMNEL